MEDLIRSGCADAEALVHAVELATLELSSVQAGAELSAWEVAAGDTHETLAKWRSMPEDEAVARLADGLLPLYDAEHRSPYIPLAAAGPWVVTAHGAVVYDAGGYGMLTLGHSPSALVAELTSRPHVQANVMTPSAAAAKAVQRLRTEVGHTRLGGCPYTHFAFLNSGSEANSLALRVADAHARAEVEKRGLAPVLLSVVGSFHGRTDRPALASDSSRPVYERHLASYAGGAPPSLSVPVNDVKALCEAFTAASRLGYFVEAVLVEPVMGEGAPATPITPDFYAAARALTQRHGALLLCDSVQAGLRTHGVLSVVDYPEFRELEAPDVETFSKAVNGGVVPLSIVAFGASAAAAYRAGLYGNTMTANPRALAVATRMLELVTPSLRENVKVRGAELLDGLFELARKHASVVTGARGVGLLVAVDIHPNFPVLELEHSCRRSGLNLIHGGKNALRLTPPLSITNAEVNLVISVLDRVLGNAGRP